MLLGSVGSWLLVSMWSIRRLGGGGVGENNTLSRFRVLLGVWRCIDILFGFLLEVAWWLFLCFIFVGGWCCYTCRIC